MSTVKPGWAFIVGGRKWHYIGEDRRSLCGAWLYLGGATEQGNDGSPDNCVSCRRKLAKLKEQGEGR